MGAVLYIHSLQFVAQNFTAEDIQAGSIKNSDGGL